MTWKIAETSAIKMLESDGFTPVESRVIVAIRSRRYVRSREKLLDLLEAHAGLESQAELQRALAVLQSRGLLVVSSTFPFFPLVLNDDKISELISEPSLHALDQLNEIEPPRINFAVPMREAEALSSFDDAVGTATSIIRLTFFSSDPSIEGIDILEARARAGVQVRVLLASPDVMSRLRGRSSVVRSRRAISAWREVERSWPNTQLRLARTVEDIELGSSMSIDGRRLRLDLHDPLFERSLDGIMLDASYGSANLIRTFDRWFDEAWTRGFSASRPRRIAMFLLRHRWLWICLALAALTMAIEDDVLMAVVTGILATSIVVLTGQYYGVFRGIASRIWANR